MGYDFDMLNHNNLNDGNDDFHIFYNHDEYDYCLLIDEDNDYYLLPCARLLQMTGKTISFAGPVNRSLLSIFLCRSRSVNPRILSSD